MMRGKALKAPMNADPTPMAADDCFEYPIRRSHWDGALFAFIGGYRRWIGGHRRFQSLFSA
jgi:hypothetical protein